MISDKIELQILQSMEPSISEVKYMVSFNKTDDEIESCETSDEEQLKSYVDSVDSNNISSDNLFFDVGDTIDYIGNDEEKLIDYVENVDPNNILHFNDKFNLFFNVDGRAVAVLLATNITLVN